MDRRTILAFAMMAAVVILYQVLFPEPQHPRAPAPATIGTDTVATSPRAAQETRIGDVAAGLQPGAGSPGRSREFRNTLATDSLLPPIRQNLPLYQTTLDPSGAVLREWVLNHYTDAQEEPADLVPDATVGLLRPVIIQDGREQRFDATRFRVEQSSQGDRSTTTLSARDESGATIQLEYSFPGTGEYTSGLRVTIDGVPNPERTAHFQLGIPAGIAHLERDPKVDRTGAAGVALIGSRLIKHHHGRGRGGWTERSSGVVRWAGVRSKYFLIAMIPQGAPDGDAIIARPEGREEITAALQFPLNLEGPTEFQFVIYAGPMDVGRLESFRVGLEKAVDLGWRVITPVSRLLLWFFQAVHRAVPNYGLCIIILSALVKVLFYPLTHKSMQSMRQMQLLKPEIDRINEKFKGDAQKRTQATMELYKKKKVNPMGGCLPLLLQMPVFIALYSVLNSAIELRKAPFVLWIRDLSAPDRVGEILGFPIHILPIFMAGTMVWQQKLTPTDPRQAAMAIMMPVVMTIFFYTMPSGLVLYWTVTNLMAVGQQIWLNRSTSHQLTAA